MGVFIRKLLPLVLLPFLFHQSRAQEAGSLISNRVYQQAKPLFGGNFAIGYGILTEEMGQYFTYPFLLPITGDFVYKRLVVQLNLEAGFSKVRQTMIFGDSTRWNKGDNAFHSALGFNLGVSIINTTDLRITPVIGWANILISKKWWGSSDISKHEPQTNYFNFALLTDLKKIYSSGRTYSSNKYDGYGAIRFTAGVYLPLEENKNYPGYYNGSFWYLSVGIAYMAAWDER